MHPVVKVIHLINSVPVNIDYVHPTINCIKTKGREKMGSWLYIKMVNTDLKCVHSQPLA